MRPIGRRPFVKLPARRRRFVVRWLLHRRLAWLGVSVGEALVVAVWLLLSLAWWFNRYDMKVSPKAGRAFSSVALVQFALLLFPIARRSIWTSACVGRGASVVVVDDACCTCRYLWHCV